MERNLDVKVVVSHLDVEEVSRQDQLKQDVLLHLLSLLMSSHIL